MPSPDTLVLFLNPLGRFQAWLSRKKRDEAREILGSLCETPGERVVSGSADELWVTKQGESLRIGDMAPEHCAHALALVMRNLRKGRVAKIHRQTNQIRFTDPERYKTWLEMHYP